MSAKNEKIKLNQDNNWKNKHNRRGAHICECDLERELKAFFGWRTPTKRYKTMKERFYGLGSHDYDRFINYLVNMGY